MDSRRIKAALVAAVVAGLAAGGIAITDGGDDPAPATPVPTAETSSGHFPTAEGGAISLALDLIEAGALPYKEDGGVFQNREALLPERPLGYYREYTVPTPGSPDRGARRLVIGDGGETYYTDDHYASFEQIDPEDFN